MVCENFGTGVDMLLGGQARDALYCAYVVPLGAAFTVGGLSGAFAAAYYLYARSFVVPVVLLVMLSGVVASGLPPGALSIVAFLLVMGLAAGVHWLIHRAQDRPT